MESNNKNKFIVVSYALYDVTKGDNGEEMLIERTTDERPFIFISGMGVTLPAFEERLMVSTMTSAYSISTSRSLQSMASLMLSTYRLVPSSHCRTRTATTSMLSLRILPTRRLHATSTIHWQV